MGTSRARPVLYPDHVTPNSIMWRMFELLFDSPSYRNPFMSRTVRQRHDRAFVVVVVVAVLEGVQNPPDLMREGICSSLIADAAYISPSRSQRNWCEAKGAHVYYGV